MKASTLRASLCLSAFLVALAIAQPAAAAQPADVREPGVLQNFRANYDAMMVNFERMAKATGNTARQERASQGRKAMRMVTDDQLIKSFGQNQVPDLSAGVMNTQFLASQVESQQKAAEGKRPMATRTAGFPEPVAVVAGCNGVDITAETRYALFITKEVVNAILAAAAWVCNEDILGENGSLACVPFAIAADVANGFFDTATFCAGEVTANQVDANFNRLEHIHDDLAGLKSDVDTRFTNLDTHLTNVDNHIATEFTTLDAHLVSLFATLGAQLANSTALLSAELKQVMKLELTPEGQRKIVPAILTCTGTNCPNVLNQCTGSAGLCSWNNVGALP